MALRLLAVQAKISEGNTTLDSATDGSITAAGHSVSVPQNGYSGPPVGTANTTSTIGFTGSPFASVTAGGPGVFVCCRCKCAWRKNSVRVFSRTIFGIAQYVL